MVEFIVVVVGLIMVLYFNGLWLVSYLVIILSSFFLVVELNFSFLYDSVGFWMMGGDLMSYYFVLFCVWVILMMMAGSCMVNLDWSLVFIYEVMILILLVFFMSLDMIVFYVSFEFILIPTFILMMGWGYQPESVSASNYLIFYTVFCSMPLFLFLVMMLDSGLSLSWLLMDMESGVSQLLGWSLLGYLAFFVKVPVYGLHLWLPKAHVEAPTSGSMILAGVLLSLGGYGLVRYFGFSWYYYSWIVGLMYGISFVGMVYLGLGCLRQVDLSAMVAYSSVVHMGLVVCGLMAGYYFGEVGSYVLMIGHGLCSSGLFYYLGVVYSWVGSRSVLFGSGMVMMFPGSVLFWFLFVSSNVSFPPSLNLLGEVYLLGGVVGFMWFLMVFLFFIMFFTGVYCLYMYSWVQHGAGADGLVGGDGVSVFEFLIMMMHWLPLNVFFLSGDLFFF